MPAHLARTWLALWLWLLCAASWAETAPRAAEPGRHAFGTGFFVSQEGHLVTAYHVLKGRKHVFVRQPNAGRWRLGQVIRTSPEDDLALVKINDITLPLPIARWRGVPIGLEVYVIGFPQPAQQGNSVKITGGMVNGEFSGGPSGGWRCETRTPFLWRVTFLRRGVRRQR